MNKRRTKSANVTADFNDETHGHTLGHFVADPETYGANKEWVVLKPVPVMAEDEVEDLD